MLFCPSIRERGQKRTFWKGGTSGRTICRYLAVQKATNSHAYERKDEIYEHWTEMNTDPDWVQYQQRPG